MSEVDRDLRAAANAIDRKDFRTAFDIYSRLADGDSAPGQHCLAWCHEQGVGTGVDLAEAFRLWNLAAKQGFAPSVFAIAACYEMGEGAEQNLMHAYSWYRVAEKLGYEGAAEKAAELRARMSPEALAEADSIISAA